MDSKIELSFEYDVLPALADLGAEVRETHFNAGSGVLHLVILLSEFSWPRRRDVLEKINDWQNGLSEDVDVDVAILSEDDLAVADA